MLLSAVNKGDPAELVIKSAFAVDRALPSMIVNFARLEEVPTLACPVLLTNSAFGVTVVPIFNAGIGGVSNELSCVSVTSPRFVVSVDMFVAITVPF